MALKYTKNGFHPTASLKPSWTKPEHSLSEKIISYPVTPHIAEMPSSHLFLIQSNFS